MSTQSFIARINKTVIARLKPGDTVWDDQLKGFGARRQKITTSYILKTSTNGKQRLITIGKHGLPWTPDTARRQAMSFKVDPSLADKGKDDEPTLNNLIIDFKKVHFSKLKPRTQKDYESVIENKILPVLGIHKIKDLRREDIVKFHQSLAETPRQANLALAIVSVILNWAEEFGHRKLNSNPCKGIKKFPSNKRQRYLTADEFGRLGQAIHSLEQSGGITIYAAAAIRLLALTGCRRSEILQLKYSYLDFERQAIFLPDSKTGAKKVNLNKPAIDVIKSLPRHVSSDYVIAGQVPGKPMVNIQKPWKRVLEIAKIENFVLHDLRHSYASLLASNGASLPMIGKLLGHSNSQTTERYAHLNDEPITELNKMAGEKIVEFLQTAPSSNSTK